MRDHMYISSGTAEGPHVHLRAFDWHRDAEGVYA
jgi:hypothetical protein